MARWKAAWPLAVHTAPTPPSSEAMRSSRTATVGLEIREYRCPLTSRLNRPAAWSTESNTYDVVWWMGTAREPVVGSGR